MELAIGTSAKVYIYQITSFPRKRESRDYSHLTDTRFHGHDVNRTFAEASIDGYVVMILNLSLMVLASVNCVKKR